MSPDLRATVRKRFVWLAAASLLALPAAGCEWLNTLGLGPGGVPTVARQPSVSGGGIGRPGNTAAGATSGGITAGVAGRGTATGLSGGASGAGNGGAGGNGGGAGH